MVIQLKSLTVKKIREIGLCGDYSFLLLGFLYFLIGLPLVIIGFINFFTFYMAEGPFNLHFIFAVLLDVSEFFLSRGEDEPSSPARLSLGFMVGLFVCVVGMYLLFISFVYIYYYLKGYKLKKSSIYVDCIIVNYKVDNKIKIGEKYVRRVVCRYSWTDGRTKEFISEPISKNPEYYIGKKVRVYGDSPEFSHYLVDLSTLNKV